MQKLSLFFCGILTVLWASLAIRAYWQQQTQQLPVLLVLFVASLMLTFGIRLYYSNRIR
ncbi:hypothetical protein [Microscilla marina]|uniref:Uncharacterized protein n=1 Tax=Microscilla marina ATCC 23134 TaxID=313606 RepID=A1ZRN2_MICM2|nr:hypothetical protein [Microscilla marina]EAY26937.1 hypothetical protein M23134_03588 [Microscilla marina ATCC 23134]